MGNEEKIIIGEKEFTRDELLAFGKCHYPKFYWIPRGIGIGCMFAGFFSISMLLLVGIAKPEIFKQSWFWAMIIPFGLLGIAGLISYIVSFKKQPDENYIKHAVDYYTRLDLNNKARDKRLAARKEKQDVNQLLKYKKLYDSGAISEEEYENKKKVILG